MTILRLLPVLLFAACATHSAIETSRNHARLGEYIRAFQVLDELRNEQLKDGGTVDETLETAHREAKLEFLRARAQQRIFQEREEGALADLLELESLAPNHPGIADLRQRANKKKAMRICALGEDCLVRKDYVGALARFLEGEKLAPGNRLALEGIERVRDATTRLSTRAQEQFLEAVRKLPEFRFIEVQWHSGNALENAPDRQEAKVLQHKARRENALAALARGKECENDGQFGAALVEYMEAQRIDPNVPEVDEAIRLMTRELKAAVLVDRAQVEMRAGRFDEARAQLGEAFDLSVMTRNDIGALVQQAKRLEGEWRYRAARDLEVLGKKSEALAAFEALAKDWPDGLQDEGARISGLRVDIDGAAKEWTEAEAAEAAGDLPKALDHYINSERFYQGWKDGKARIARLRAALEPAGGSTDTRGTDAGRRGTAAGGSAPSGG